MHNISVVVSYCSLENRFMRKLINECLKFTKDIVVASFDKFLDETEDTNLIKDFDIPYVNRIIVPIFKIDNKLNHNLLRWCGLKQAKNDFILFLDGDEIPDGQLMDEYLSNVNYKKYDAISFMCYWYFREPFLRANTTEECGVMLKKELLNKDWIFHESERWNFRNKTNNFLDNQVHEGKIIMHHYSWVRTKDQMLQKVKAWAHSHERNWTELVEEEFKGEFKGRDFVHNYTYQKVETDL